MRWRVRAAKLVLLLASLIVSLALGELVARALVDRAPETPEELAAALDRSRRTRSTEGTWAGVGGIVEAGPTEELIYQLRPNLRGTFRGQSFATNSWGLRDDELEREKAAGTYRIVGLGDSHMFGWGVAQDEVYLARLERSLSVHTGRQIEVVNCGVPGYNTVLEVALYEAKCAAFAPDLVIIHVIGNDFYWPHFLRAVRETPRRSALLDLITSVLTGANEGEDASEELFHDVVNLADPAHKDAVERYEQHLGEPGALRALKRLAASTRASDTAVLMISLGSGGRVRERLLSAAREHGFAVADVSPVFAELLAERGLGEDRAAWKAAFVLPRDGHPTPLGHEAYARALEPLVAPFLH